MALEEGKPWTPWGASDEQSKALLQCVGVQRFRILSLETREPYPIAHVRLFTDETSEHKEPELDEVLAVSKLCFESGVAPLAAAAEAAAARTALGLPARAGNLRGRRSSMRAR